MEYNPNAIKMPMPSAYSREIGGKEAQLYILKNTAGMQVAITNYGAYLLGAWVPDKKGDLTSVILGFEDIDGLLKQRNYYGATVGRYANRIGGGKFTLEEKEYNLTINNGPNSLHGGIDNFSSRVWDAAQLDHQTLILELLSEDMNEGYPGNLDVKVTYTLTDDNAIKIAYEATTDQTTIINLTNHSYFNLNGEGNGDILDHIIQIAADNYTPIDATLIPTGEIASVKNTPFDFTKPETVGKRINADDEQIKFGNGYDHNVVLNDHALTTPVTTVVGDKSGIKMEVFTDQPGMQFYTGNFMSGANTQRSGVNDKARTGFALETQHFPDSPNKPHFPSVVLKPGEVYRTQTTYKFSV
jgi:aldose 1-epimerase